MFAHSPIIVPCEDALVHTDAQPYCSDSTCPCYDDKPPVGTRVLIEVEIRGYFNGSMTIAGGWMPLSRIKGIVLAQDVIADVPPSEDALDEQERETGTHPPNCRCGWCEPQ